MKTFFALLALAFSVSHGVAADGGFLFVTFRNEPSVISEQIYFALSRDGRDWQALKDGKPVLMTELGEKGARDPYLLRSADGRDFVLIATDLNINRNGDWKRAVEAGSKSLLVWKSSDLVRWSEPRLIKVAPDDAGCTWAPEAIYDPASQRYLVYWASTTKRDQFQKHRIWAAWTTDFETFSEPFIYLEKPVHVIDADIVRDGGRYYRFIKDETFKAIAMETSDQLIGDWKPVESFTLGQMRGYEGPQCYELTPGAWCLIADHYQAGKGYEPFVTTNLAKGDFKPAPGFTFPFVFRHGSVIAVSAEEYARLAAAFPSAR